jgi:hypothetical protein
MLLQTVRKPSYGNAPTNLYEDSPTNLSTLDVHVTVHRKCILSSITNKMQHYTIL